MGTGLTELVNQLITQITADLADDTPDISLYRAMLGQMVPAQANGDTGQTCRTSEYYGGWPAQAD